MKKCPKCNSKNVEIIDEEMGFIQCKKCGHNELTEEVDFGERETQREKRKQSPYRQTGGRRHG